MSLWWIPRMKVAVFHLQVVANVFIQKKIQTKDVTVCKREGEEYVSISLKVQIVYSSFYIVCRFKLL